MNEGYSFIWNAGELPYLVTPDGHHLRDGQVQCHAGSAPSSSSSSSVPPPAAPEAAEAHSPLSPPSGEAGGVTDGEEPDDGVDDSLHEISHRVKEPNCPTCRVVKLHASPARRRGLDAHGNPLKFGDSVTADHAVVSPEDCGRGAKGLRLSSSTVA